jgi:V-type H+-transporting ATPase proteolipid subunit
VIGDVGVQCFGLKASGGKRAWLTGEGANANEAKEGAGDVTSAVTQEAANKLYVGLLIMLIFAEALALYGLIVALILSQNTYSCKNN